MPNNYYYRAFCASHPGIPIFSQPWWLDAVCPGQWDFILIEKNGKIVASFPYYKTKFKRIFTHIGLPPLTQKLGPYIDYGNGKLTEMKKIGYEHEIYNKIIDRLPKCDVFSINFDWKYKNWLPFYWRGYRQSTRYTYILDNIKNHEYTYSKYKVQKAQKIHKARKILSLHFDLPPDIFYQYFADVVRDRGEDVGFSKELFYRMHDAVYAHNAGRTFYCIDAGNNIHAINLTIWDNESAYYLIAMRKKEFNTSGGTEFLVDETIKYVSQFVNRFDFEGSMMKGVEEAFRYYGAHQTEYYTISRCNNLPLRVYRSLRGN